jgi:hypothetical protein
MKTKVIILSAFMAVLAIPATMAQAPIQATATVEVGVPLTLTLVDQSVLNFGKVNTSASAGNCVISTAGVASAHSGVSLNGGTPSAVAFTTTGRPSGTYVVTIPSSLTITRVGGSQTVTVDNFLVRGTGAAADSPIVTLGATGFGGFTVGATLSLGSNQADGTYTSQFPVTVAYQ